MNKDNKTIKILLQVLIGLSLVDIAIRLIML
nr:MAG TPA: hypothetical protein [Caudoviricetes sp.]